MNQYVEILRQEGPTFAESPAFVTTLGRQAVEHHQKSVLYEQYAEKAHEAISLASQVELDKDPPMFNSRFLRKIDHALANGMSDDEAELVQLAHRNRFLPVEAKQKAIDTQVLAKHELHEVRRKLFYLTKDQSYQLDKYCNAASSHFLMSVKNRQSRENSWSDWLSMATTDEELTNFLQWHVAVIQNQQTDPEALALIEQEKHEFKIGVAEGVEAQWFHKDALHALTEVDATRVYIGDIFDTLMQEKGGYCHRDENMIVIAGPSERGNSSTLRHISHALKHELNHATLGGYGGLRWLDEAVTEHIAEVFESGQPDIVDPTKRDIFNPTYREERALLADVLTAGGLEIPMILLTRGYSEINANTARFQAQEAIENSWGHLVPPGKMALLQVHSWVRQLELEFVDKGLTAMKAGSIACRQARQDLRENPELVFGHGAQKPDLVLT